jgi:branched-chain amino acid transport system permease protein
VSGYFLQQIVNGLILGSLYALVAIGFSLIYGIIRLVNFAHGDLVMVGAFVALATALAGWAPGAGVFVVAGAGFAVGAAIERLAFRTLRGAPMVTGFIVTLSVSVAIQNLALMLVGTQPRNFVFPAVFRARVDLWIVEVAVIDLVIPAVALGLAAATVLFVARTRLGKAMRAVSENVLAARLMGIDVNRTVLVAFGLGSALAAVAGLFWGGKYGQIDPLMGLIPGLKAFVATVIGGVGSIGGAVLGGYLLGLGEVLFVGLLPAAYAGYRDALVFGLLILVLLVRPNGLLGRDEEERA